MALMTSWWARFFPLALDFFHCKWRMKTSLGFGNGYAINILVGQSQCYHCRKQAYSSFELPSLHDPKLCNFNKMFPSLSPLSSMLYILSTAVKYLYSFIIFSVFLQLSLQLSVSTYNSTAIICLSVKLSETHHKRRMRKHWSAAVAGHEMSSINICTESQQAPQPGDEESKSLI